jgi:hypothetical protein
MDYMLTAGKHLAALLLITGFSLAADPTSVPASAKEREAQAQAFVNDKLHLWQRHMNLAHWTIEANLVRHSTLKPKTLGGIHWDRNTMTASIEVLSTYDYKLGPQEMLDDMEFTVVHELVHLQLSSLPRSEASRSAEEHAVNEIAGALLKLAKK